MRVKTSHAAAIDLARIMEEHVCDVVDDYRRRTT